MQVGLAALQRAMQEPTRVIVDNAGKEGAVVVGKLLEGDSKSNMGYNAATGKGPNPSVIILRNGVGLSASCKVRSKSILR